MEIEEILERLFGEIQPLCDSQYDDERYENLDNYEKVFNYLVNEITECAKWKNDNHYSAKKLGERAFSILEQNYKEIKDTMDMIK